NTQATAKLNKSSKLPIQGTCCNSGDPRCNVGHSSGERTGVTCGASNNNTLLDGMKRANGDGIFEVIGRFTTEGHRDDIHAIIDRSVKCRHNVRVEALVEVDRGPTDLVTRDSSLRRASFRGSRGGIEDLSTGNKVASCC
ncbi:hypothetical protein LINGRAHAP2_LOCUS16668, partial [Linum grandiflorum]